MEYPHGEEYQFLQLDQNFYQEMEVAQQLLREIFLYRSIHFFGKVFGSIQYFFKRYQNQ